MGKKNGSIIIVLIFSQLLLSGCRVFTPPNEFPYQLMLKEHDLPPQFDFKESAFPETEQGTAYYLSYETGDNEIAQFIVHQVAIYPDESTAKEQYSEGIKSAFSNNSYTPKDIDFKPRSNSDKFELMCINTLVNGMHNMACEVIQLHGNLVVYVLGHINHATMTLDEFERTLHVLDKRLPENKVSMPPGQ